MADVKDWTDDHPTEFVILRLQKDDGPFYEFVVNVVKDNLWNGQSGADSNILLAADGHELGEMTMGELRGKIWVALNEDDASEWQEYSSVYSGLWKHEESGGVFSRERD